VVIRRLRPNLLALSEIVEIPDEMFPSSIGNSYGDIYEAQFEWARDSRQNKVDEEHGGRPFYFEQLMRPFLKSDYTNYKPVEKL